MIILTCLYYIKSMKFNCKSTTLNTICLVQNSTKFLYSIICIFRKMPKGQKLYSDYMILYWMNGVLVITDIHDYKL